MPVVPFGFSVGDFVTVITLIWQACESLNEASSCHVEFQQTKLELKSSSLTTEGLSVTDHTRGTQQEPQEEGNVKKAGYFTHTSSLIA
jgi:hypothetical protein